MVRQVSHVVSVCAGKELTLAQKLSRGKGAGQREQEDAQEFLTFLLDSTHQELLKLRAMYGTSGREPRAMCGTSDREHTASDVSRTTLCSFIRPKAVMAQEPFCFLVSTGHGVEHLCCYSTIEVSH